MHIAIFGLGGVTQTFRQWPERVLGERLVRLGHSVVFYGYHDPRSPHFREKEEEIADIRVHRLPPRFWPSGALRRAMAGEVVPDVAHFFHPRNVLAFSATRLLRRWRVPIVYTWLGPFHDPFLVDDREDPYRAPPHYDRLIHTFPMLLRRVLHDGRLRAHLRNYFLHRPLFQADLHLACSEHETEELARMGIARERIRRVPLWIERDWITAIPYRPPERTFGRPLLLYIGQLTRRKGADLLVEAMPEVARAYPQATFVLVTHNPAGREDLQARAAALGLADHLHILGPVSEEEKIALLRACDVYVLPTRYEGFGLPLLEAMACRAPVITTDIPVVREIVHDGENGLLVPREDSQALAQAILRLLGDPDLRRRLADGGERTLRERYDGERLVQEVLQVYREAMALARKERGDG
ncbi:MAG: glycosyltransferase family 4 protein [Chloroflexia bacterium]